MVLMDLKSVQLKGINLQMQTICLICSLKIMEDLKELLLALQLEQQQGVPELIINIRKPIQPQGLTIAILLLVAQLEHRIYMKSTLICCVERQVHHPDHNNKNKILNKLIKKSKNCLQKARLISKFIMLLAVLRKIYVIV